VKQVRFSLSTVNIQTITGAALANMLPGSTFLFTGGRNNFSVSTLADSEVAAIQHCFDDGVNILRKSCPNIYQDIYAQKSASLVMGQVAKGTLSSTGGTKPVLYPSQPGSIGVNWLFPEAVRYIAINSSTNPAYADYAVDSWNISITSGSLVNLLGSATLTGNTPPTSVSTVAINNYYKASSNNNQHEMFFVFQNGVIEVGSTPAIQQWNLQTQAANTYGIYVTESANVINAELDKSVYQYNTIGLVPVFYDLGISWTGMATATQTSTIQLLGMVFYEHQLFPNQTLI
jgi:hypothetical protein